jgi:predicted nucleotidyltransferase
MSHIAADSMAIFSGFVLLWVMLKNKKLVEVIEHKINQYICGSADAKRTILAVYLFRSVLDNEKKKNNSDIDLAFLVDLVLYKQDPFMASSPAYLAAMHIGLMLNRQTDVIDLNSASIETTYQVLTTGKVIFEADQDSRIGYEIVLKGLYFDFKPFLNNLRKRVILRISDKESRA